MICNPIMSLFWLIHPTNRYFDLRDNASAGFGQNSFSS